MPTFKKKVSFYESEEGADTLRELTIMAKDLVYNTGSSFSADAERYPDNKIPFVDKHMKYLNAHPSVNPQQYISNLRLMTKRR
ncbi:MAG TPA: hypothetical protein VF809_00525 [Candidatus Saccharimonadales bacterium]|jgi:hypothetical protein